MLLLAVIISFWAGVEWREHFCPPCRSFTGDLDSLLSLRLVSSMRQRELPAGGLESSGMKEVREYGEVMMNDWLKEGDGKGKKIKFELLYNGTEYGCSAITFHKKCDGKGPTVTFAKSAEHGRVFGGYTSKSWNSSSQGDY